MTRFYFQTTEQSACPMRASELMYWLSMGRQAFRVAGEYWMRMRLPSGASSMVNVPEKSIAACGDLVEASGAVVALSDEYFRRAQYVDSLTKNRKDQVT